MVVKKAVVKGRAYLVHWEERVPLLEELVEVVRHLLLGLGVLLAVRKACQEMLEHSCSSLMFFQNNYLNCKLKN